MDEYLKYYISRIECISETLYGKNILNIIWINVLPRQQAGWLGRGVGREHGA